uniref:Uncharacterized protein n=1 Tax=Populus trichocarpa TaxID=3694 RepID=A0A3N7EB84_POPTR
MENLRTQHYYLPFAFFHVSLPNCSSLSPLDSHLPFHILSS